MKTLTEEMFDHIAACFTGIWIIPTNTPTH